VKERDFGYKGMGYLEVRWVVLGTGAWRRVFVSDSSVMFYVSFIITSHVEGDYNGRVSKANLVAIAFH